MKKTLLIATGALLLTACSAQQEVEEVTNVSPDKVEQKIDRVSRELTNSWGNTGLGGAALRQPGYINVLGKGNLGDRQSQGRLVGGSDTNPSALVTAVKDIESARGDNAGFSVYELSRWSRYCNAGKGMDEPDWQFVTKNGGPAGVPPSMKKSCTLPGYDYEDYLGAWVNYCTSSGPTSHEISIVSKSVRPKSRVNPCAAMK